MSDSIAPVSSIEMQSKPTLEDLTAKMSKVFNDVDAANKKWGTSYTRNIEDLLPRPSESRHMRDMLNSVKDPNMKDLMTHSLKMADKMNEFNKMYLKGRASSSLSSSMMGNMLKASGLTVAGIKQLLSAQ